MTFGAILQLRRAASAEGTGTTPAAGDSNSVT